MTIESSCHGCGKRLRVADEYAGRQARCPECGYVYTVPSASSPSAGSPASGETPLNSPVSEPKSGSEVTSSSSAYASSSARDSHSGDSQSGESSRVDSNSGTLSQASSSAESWYMKTPEGQIYGPATREVLHTWVAEGRVTEDCQLRRGEHGQWTGAAEIFPQLRAPQYGGAYQTGGGTYATASSSGYSQPYRPAGYSTGGRYVQPHRGGLILTFAILGWAFCPIFSIVAWTMGTTDIQQMRAGLMDNSGMGMTQAGQILGMISSCLAIVGVGFFFLMMICMAAAGAAGA